MRVQDIQADNWKSIREEKDVALNTRRKNWESTSLALEQGRWTWEIDSGAFAVSSSWKEMLGFTDSKPVSLEMWESLLHSEDKRRTLNDFNNFVKSDQEQFQLKYRMRHSDGEYRWISSKARAVRDNYGRIINISASDVDLARQGNHSQSVEKSERKYRNLFQNSLVALGTMKADLSNVVEGNEKFWAFIGLEEDQRTTFSFESLLPKRQRKELIGALNVQNTIDNFEIQVTTADGKENWVLMSAILYPEEELIDFVLKDITQTKENLIELQKVNFELDSFVYHASHDLRSPLRSILGLIDLYRMEDDDKMQEECIEKIQVSVRKLDDLVIELLSISRNDRVNDPFTEINLMQEVNSSIASYINASDTSNLEITCKILQPVSFMSDATRIRIILNNIISNAIKYRSFRRDVSTIEISAEVNESEAIISISDNGEGIEASKVPHIFDMFYRATAKSEGSGLGLYIVKKVADKLEAKINVESEELEGTTFTVTIPNGK